MTNNQQRAAEVIYGTLSGQYGDFGFPTDAAQALADAGLLMPDGSLLSREWAWTSFDQGSIYIRYAVGDTYLSPVEARELALDLLAAADHTEKYT